MSFVLGLLKNYGALAIKALVCLSFFFCGYFLAKYKHEARIADLLKQSAILTAEANKNDSEKLAAAFSKKLLDDDKFFNFFISNTAVVERLRSNAASGAGKNIGPGGIEEKECPGCRKLLLESLELLDEGCRRFGKCASEKDSIARILP